MLPDLSVLVDAPQNVQRLQVPVRTPEVIEDMEKNTGLYAQLSSRIREAARDAVLAFAEKAKEREAAGHDVRPDEAYKRLVERVALVFERADTFAPQALLEIEGYVHTERITDATFLALVNAYRTVRSDDIPVRKQSGSYTLEGPHEAFLVNNALAPLAEQLMPLIDALRQAGFVDKNHNKQFIIKWRIHRGRHERASIWHMDEGAFSPYGDESGDQLEAWTANGTRCIVTSGCVEASGKDNTFGCATRVLSGTPVMRQGALESLMDVFREAFKKRFRVNLVSRIMNSSIAVIKSFLDEGKSLAAAGVQTMQLDNGVISTFNDSLWHAAVAEVPVEFERVFLVACPTIRNQVNRVVPFIHHARLRDGSEVMFQEI